MSSVSVTIHWHKLPKRLRGLLATSSLVTFRLGQLGNSSTIGWIAIHLHSTPLFVSLQVSLAPQLCPLNCKNASTAVLPSVSGRIVYNLWSLCNLLDWQVIVSKCDDLMVSLKQPVIYDTYSAMPINWYSYRRWSLGVILYILPSGTPPFSEDRWLFVSFDSFAHQILSWPSVW